VHVVLLLLAKIILHCLGYIGHLTNTSAFPQPLSAQEEKEYFERYKNGDQEAKNILIERNLRLVAHIVKKYQSTGYDCDDLISIGTIGLIKAITTFDPEKNTRLATYASRCIENEILMCLRASKKMQSEVSLQEPIGFDGEGNEVSLMDILSSYVDVSKSVELNFQIKKLYEKISQLLKGREKLVLLLRYGLANGCTLTQREIAKKLGISRSYVSRIEKRAVKKLINEFKGEDFLD